MAATEATRVHLVRHGKVHNPEHVMYGLLPGWHLSDEGIAQAHHAAEHLSSRPIEAVYSSPLERAVATATVIAEECGVPLEVREELTEWRLGAHWGGMRWKDIPTERPDEWEAYMERPNQLDFLDEPLDELARRMLGAVAAVALAHPGGEAAVVSHSDPIKAAALLLAGRPLEGLHEMSVPTGGIVTIEIGPDSGALIELWPEGV